MQLDQVAICALQEPIQLVLACLVLLVLPPSLVRPIAIPVLVVQNQAPTEPLACLAWLVSTLLVTLAYPVQIIKYPLLMPAPAKYVHQVPKHREMVETAILVQSIPSPLGMAFAFLALLVRLLPALVLPHVFLMEIIIRPVHADLN